MPSIKTEDFNKSLREFMGDSNFVVAEFVDDSADEKQVYEFTMRKQSGVLNDFIDCTAIKLDGQPAWQVDRSQPESLRVGELLMRIAGLDADQACKTDPVDFFKSVDRPARMPLTGAQIDQIGDYDRNGVFFVHGGFKTETTTKMARNGESLLEYVASEEYARELTWDQYSRLIDPSHELDDSSPCP